MNKTLLVVSAVIATQLGSIAWGQIPNMPSAPKAPTVPSAPSAAAVTQAAKDKAAEAANAQANKMSEFHVGAPVSNQLAAIAKTKAQTATGKTAYGKFTADCKKNNTDKDFDCLIKPEIEVRQ